MQQFRNLLIIVGILAATLGGVFLINQINQNNALESSSANVYNLVALSQVEDDTLYVDKVVVDLNSQILVTTPVTSGNFELTFDKDLLEVEDIIMSSNVIAVNQKINNSAGTISLEVRSANATGFKDITNFAKIIFDKKQDPGRFTSVTLSADSTLGTPNTLDGLEKSVSISF
ncbi:hypothetical protein DOJK_01897 [Patescibacteria group bacterium]|nr:hypothetical protein [Candidatus Dojkabacteria bacterium]CAG1022788.1 hypothetical protein DOJK_01897 [Patescibacteria group bacterium]